MDLERQGGPPRRGGAAARCDARTGPHNRATTIGTGQSLRIQTPGPSRVLWRLNDEREERAVLARETALSGVWITDLDTTSLSVGTTLRFALHVEGGSVDGEHDVTITQAG